MSSDKALRCTFHLIKYGGTTYVFCYLSLDNQPVLSVHGCMWGGMAKQGFLCSPKVLQISVQFYHSLPRIQKKVR